MRRPHPGNRCTDIPLLWGKLYRLGTIPEHLLPRSKLGAAGTHHTTRQGQDQEARIVSRWNRYCAFALPCGCASRICPAVCCSPAAAPPLCGTLRAPGPDLLPVSRALSGIGRRPECELRHSSNCCDAACIPAGRWHLNLSSPAHRRCLAPALPTLPALPSTSHAPSSETHDTAGVPTICRRWGSRQWRD